MWSASKRRPDTLADLSLHKFVRAYLPPNRRDAPARLGAGSLARFGLLQHTPCPTPVSVRGNETDATSTGRFFKRFFRIALGVSTAILLLAPPATADVRTAVDDHILPRYAAFSRSAATLATAADTDCATLQPAFHATFDAWLAIAHIRLGPVETDGRALAIAFWPDPKGIGQRQQAAMLATQDPIALDPTTFATASVATRGLFALERLVYPAQPLTGDYPCTLIRATAHDLARMARAIESDWQATYATAILIAGQPGNTTYLSETEAKQALFTQLITGIEFTKDNRIARPLGTFDKPRPERAEAKASTRTQRNIVLSLQALRDFAFTLDPQATKTQTAFDRAIATAQSLPDPTLAMITDPQIWLKLDILKQHIQSAHDAALTEIGTSLNVGVGFNAADGD